MSDLHGCKDEFDQMLKIIDFTEYDELWIDGDVCDRGRHSIALLQEIMHHDNMHMIFGNHDVWLARYTQELIDAKKDSAYVDTVRFKISRGRLTPPTYNYITGGY